MPAPAGFQMAAKGARTGLFHDKSGRRILLPHDEMSCPRKPKKTIIKKAKVVGRRAGDRRSASVWLAVSTIKMGTLPNEFKMAKRATRAQKTAIVSPCLPKENAWPGFHGRILGAPRGKEY